MKGNLLDTSVALIAQRESSRLPLIVREAVVQGPNFLSVISWWEVMLKSIKGKLDVGDPRLWWSESLDLLAATPLSFRPQHIAGIHNLPPIHRDPFDRALLSQATVEGLTLVTTDSTLGRYASPDLRVIA